MPGSRLIALFAPALGVALLLQAPQAARESARDRELTEQQQVQHVLNRLAFGGRPDDAARVRELGVDRWIAQQLEPSRLRDPLGDAAVAAYPHLGKGAADLARAYPPPNLLRARQRRDGMMSAADSQAIRQAARASRELVGDILSARVSRAVVSERQLQEVLTDFWLNHFSVFIGKNQLMRYQLPEYEQEAIRPHVLGRFRDLLGAVAQSPAMLIYLDNAQSVADSTQPTLAGREVADRRIRAVRQAIARNDRRGANRTRVDTAMFDQLMARRPRGLNENYARELLELHTLGVDGGYVQQDVIEVARALTGWTVRPARLRGDGGFWFNPATHDAGEKVVLGHPMGSNRGIADGEQVLDIVARHPATARHIAHKLAVRFVSDSPPPALIDRTAQVFRDTDGDLRAVVRAIVTSPEFFSRVAYRSKVKSPLETVVSTLRALGAGIDTTAVTAMLVARLGQPIYGRQSPDGWPETGSEWMNTGAILNRINFGMAVASNRLPHARPTEWPGYAKLRSVPRQQQVQGIIDGLLGGEVSTDTRRILESGTNPMLEDPPQEAVPDDRRSARQAGGLGEIRPLTGLDQIIGLALGSPEFQRR
jgi:uncharacterized protein (DUF1800 family)